MFYIYYSKITAQKYNYKSDDTYIENNWDVEDLVQLTTHVPGGSMRKVKTNQFHSEGNT